jgi:hypothetical protein
VWQPRELDRIAAEIHHTRDPVGAEPAGVEQVQVHVVVRERRQCDPGLRGQRAVAEVGVGSEELAQQERVVVRHPSPTDL